MIKDICTDADRLIQRLRKNCRTPKRDQSSPLEKHFEVKTSCETGERNGNPSAS
jgi:hypothetical protein